MYIDKFTNNIAEATIQVHEDIKMELPEGLCPSARFEPVRHQLRFRRCQAGLEIGQKKDAYSVTSVPPW
jgi:hypothetical protein